MSGVASDTAETGVDEPRQAVLDDLTKELGDAVVGSEIRCGDLWVRVRADAWRRTAEVCRKQLDFDYFCFLSGLDWMQSTAPNPKVVAGVDADQADADQAEVAPTADAPLVTGFAGGEGRFQVLARLYSLSRKVGVTFKADLDPVDPAVETWSTVYPGADWCERETWEMYGFRFDGHPNLIKLYLPGEFEGFPLRKDFPLLSREVKPWPGLVDVEPMPGGDDPASEEEG